MVVPKRDRLEEFFRRLLQAPNADTLEEALRQMINILNAVEDELTSIPYDPGHWRHDERIYPPQPDNMHEVHGHPHVMRFRSLGHNACIGANGSIEIVSLDGTVELRKNGVDGRGVWDLN